MRLPRPTASVIRFFSLLLCLPLLGSAQAEDAEKPGNANAFAGHYKKYCSVCHGKGGDGKSSAAQGMTPPPTDFTSSDALVGLTRERMLQSVSEGRPHTAMTAWKGVLTPEEIAGVVDYIRTTLMLASRAQDATQGRRLYARRCSVCHGDRGDVAVWARGGLVPPPRDFTTESARRELTQARMIFSISYGRPETAMPSWLGRLTAEEIEMVTSYIREAFMFPGGEEKNPSPKDKKETKSGHDHGAATEAKSHEQHNHDHYDAADMRLPLPKGLVGDTAWGEKFYQKNCVACHGEKGDGKGPRADFVYPKPRDFLHPSSRHKLNRAHLFEVISKGTRGTEMPAWGKVLTEQEIANLAEYLFRTFISSGEESAPLPAAGGHDHADPAPVTDGHDHQHPPPPASQESKPAPATAPAGHDHQHPPPPASQESKPAPVTDGHDHQHPPPPASQESKPAPATAPAGHDHHDHAHH
ncbi:MAG: c-type cytochrome [Magnetococcus sp. YQC-3]